MQTDVDHCDDIESPPVPPEVLPQCGESGHPPPPLESPPGSPPLSQEPTMTDVKLITAPKFVPVSVGTKVKPPPQVQIKMINDRASHYYFRRIHKILRSLGKMR